MIAFGGCMRTGARPPLVLCFGSGVEHLEHLECSL